MTWMPAASATATTSLTSPPPCVRAPSWIQVNLSQLVTNAEILQAELAPHHIQLIPTIKADAYGHGAVAVNQVLLEAGFNFVAVAALAEAVTLRAHQLARGIPMTDSDILVMSYCPPADIATAAELGITMTVYDPEIVRQYVLVLRDAGVTKPLAVHIKVDSGFGRVGSLPTDFVDLLQYLATVQDTIIVRGIYTHYSRADDNISWTKQQYHNFMAMLVKAGTEDQLTFPDLQGDGAPTVDYAQLMDRVFDCLRSGSCLQDLAGVDVAADGSVAASAAPRWLSVLKNLQYVHTCNSAASVRAPELCGSAARVGIALYGGMATPEQPRTEGVQPALRWLTSVAQVKFLPGGHTIGYGQLYTVPAEGQHIAVLPVGYSNGVRRSPKPWSHVKLQGYTLPLLGRVSMEKIAVDVQPLYDAGLQVHAGDEAILMDWSGHNTVQDVAQAIGTIDYDVFTSMLARQPRSGPLACSVEYIWPNGTRTTGQTL